MINVSFEMFINCPCNCQCTQKTFKVKITYADARTRLKGGTVDSAHHSTHFEQG